MVIKLAKEAPPATVTVAGTINKGLLLASVTVAPAIGAGAESVMLQVDVWELPRLVDEQLSELMVGGAESVKFACIELLL